MVKKILTFAVGLILTVAFITMLTQYFNTGKRSAEGTMSQANALLSDNADVMYSQYKQGSTITGAELVALLQSNTAITITVKTGANSAGQAYTTGPAPAIETNKYQPKYINPNKTFFLESETTDGNGIITALVFKQK